MGSSPHIFLQHHLPVLLLIVFIFAYFPPANYRTYAADQNIGAPEAPLLTDAAVLTSCADARYPTLCIRTLSRLPPANHDPVDFAVVAVSASLASAREAATFLSQLPVSSSAAALEPLDDCQELLTDSLDLLEETEGMLHRLMSRQQLENALTWAGAAMTNQDTCVDGLHESGTDAEEGVATVVQMISQVSQYNSNALHLIGRLASAPAWIQKP